MARLALVSRNPAMSMALSSTEHTLVEIRANDLDEWLANGEDVGVDALVLDLGSPTLASRVVGDLRAQGRWVPVVLVAADDPAWNDAKVVDLPGVDVLSLPLDPRRLQDAVAAVLRHPRMAPNPNQAVVQYRPADEPLLDEVPDLAALRHPGLLEDDASPSLEGFPPAPEPAPEPAPLPEPEPDPQPEPLPEPEPEPVLEPVLERTRRQRRRDALNAEHQDLEPPPLRLDPSEPPAAAPTPRSATSGRHSADDPVHALLEEAHRFYTLEESATVVVEDAVTRTMADAGALLVPDGSFWRVAAGVALRPLEYRLQLGPESWLVERIAHAGKGVLIEESDVVRQDLRGAPLASRTHLMAVPVSQVHAVLLLSRDRKEPFSENSLAALAGLADEAGPLLQRAIDVRSLARLLARHIDIEGFPEA